MEEVITGLTRANLNESNRFGRSAAAAIFSGQGDLHWVSRHGNWGTHQGNSKTNIANSACSCCTPVLVVREVHTLSGA
jgi:hypothetical protein